MPLRKSRNYFELSLQIFCYWSVNYNFISIILDPKYLIQQQSKGFSEN